MPLVTRIVAVIDVPPVDVQVAPVMPPPPLLDDELVELELVLELLVLELDVELEELELDDPPERPYEQYRGLPTLVDGNREARTGDRAGQRTHTRSCRTFRRPPNVSR